MPSLKLFSRHFDAISTFLANQTTQTATLDHSLSSGQETPAGQASKATEIAAALKNLSVAGGTSPLLDSSARSVTSGTSGTSPRAYTTKVGILPSSVPAYHREYMEREKAGLNGEEVEVVLADPAAPDPNMPEVPIQPRSLAEQEETARRLKPHLRGSQTALGGAGAGGVSAGVPGTGPPLHSLTPVSAAGTKKSKPARWQFGIRSRNQPFEALLCIYKSLQKLGAAWMVDEDYELVHGPEGQNSEYVFLCWFVP